MAHAFDRIVVLDFEATCEPGGAPVPQEIIELPSVLVSLSHRVVQDETNSFVRPAHHPQLSVFCKELTTIRQEDVDAAPPFLDAFARHRAWLDAHDLFDAHGNERFAFVTCGDWDLATMLPVQCRASGLSIAALPRAYRRWINVKKVSAEVTGNKPTGMHQMLEAVGLALIGTHHRGIDDSRNIARLALALADRGGVFEINGRLSASHYPELPLELEMNGRIERVTLKKRALGTLLGLASTVFRTQIGKVSAEDGTELTEEALFELPPHIRLAASK